jgi:hypothetical protein
MCATETLKLNPDIVTPGIEVLTTLSAKSDAYNFISDISFAILYVLSCIALMYQELFIKAVPVHVIISAFQNTITPISSSSFDGVISVAHQGARPLNIIKAITQRTFALPPVLGLVDLVSRKGGKITVSLNIMNTDYYGKEYRLIHRVTVSLRSFDDNDNPIFSPRLETNTLK